MSCDIDIAYEKGYRRGHRAALEAVGKKIQQQRLAVGAFGGSADMMAALDECVRIIEREYDVELLGVKEAS
jgi:hypothetical protein